MKACCWHAAPTHICAARTNGFHRWRADPEPPTGGARGQPGKNSFRNLIKVEEIVGEAQCFVIDLRRWFKTYNSLGKHLFLFASSKLSLEMIRLI